MSHALVSISNFRICSLVLRQEFCRREVEIVPERARQIAREFAARQNAVDLLPCIVQHHTFNKKAIEASRDRAQQLIVTTDALIEEFSS
jgi:hypothetical protein